MSTWDVWALRGKGKQAGWSRIGSDLTVEEVEALTENEARYHVEEHKEER